VKASLTAILAILRKDLQLELRSKEVIVSILVFALMVIVIFSFAVPPGVIAQGEVAQGMLWVAYTFAGILGLNRSFAAERENYRYFGLLLCPVDRMVIYWGKFIAVLIFMLVVAMVLTPIFLVLFNLPLWLPWLMLTVALTMTGFAAVGTLFAALAANTRLRDIALPILFLPVVVPLLIAAVKVTGQAIEGGAWADMSLWFAIMAACDIIYLVVASLTFEYVIEE
jgi:heme exporter protein B